MQAKVDKKLQKVFEDYLRSRKAVIADTNRSSRTGIARTLTDMGMKSIHIQIAENYETAKQMIEANKPEIVIADYELGASSGLNLLQEQRLGNPASKTSIFVIVTGNNSQSAIAQAAEEDVDTFILKPYTIEVFKKCLFNATMAKLNPSEYIKTIEAGKKLLFAGSHAEAIEVFKKATALDPKPSLAFFYIGQAEIMKKLMDEASSQFKNGLNVNKIHYKCLVGLFDLLMEEKKFQEAYDCMKRVAQYFPANPKRLASVIRLAVMTNSVEDMEKYYQIFTNIESRGEELTKMICAGLVVCGKFYLKTKLNSRALELFQKAAVSSAGQTKFLKEIISALSEYKMAQEAQKFLDRYPADERKGPDYLTAEFLIMSRTISPSLAMQKGRTLVSQGIEDPSLYRELIRTSNEAGVKDYAEQLLQQAKQKWPAQVPMFEKAIEKQ